MHRRMSDRKNKFYDWKLLVLYIHGTEHSTMGELERRRLSWAMRKHMWCIRKTNSIQSAHDISTKRKRRMTHSDGSFFFSFVSNFFSCLHCVEGNRRSKHFECVFAFRTFFMSLWLVCFRVFYINTLLHCNGITACSSESSLLWHWIN